MKNIFYDKEKGFSKTFGFKKASKGRTREFIAKLSRGLMLPIAMLPIAGLFLGIGATIATQAGNAGILGLETFGRFIRNAGDVIFGALPALFAIAVAIAFTKDSGVAGLSAFIGYLVFAGLQTALLEPVMDGEDVIGYNLLFYTQGVLGEVSTNAGLPTSVVGTTLGLAQLQTSVFGGLLVGFVVAGLYNRFKNIQLPAVLGFFNGARFIPIVTFAAIFPIALLIMILWPLIGVGLTYFGGILGSNMLGFNSFIFGFIERSLVPFGLHHAFYSPLWYSSVGGVLALDDLAVVSGSFTDINGDGLADTWAQLAAAFGGDVSSPTIGGDQVIWSYVNSTFAGRNVTLLGENAGTATITFSDFTTSAYSTSLEKLNPNLEVASAGVNISQYMQGKYTFMIFGLPAAALAMVYAAPKENRKMASSVVIAAGFTSMLTGITEPIEFTFLFLTPWLFWGFHAFMCAISFGLMNWIGLIIPETAPHIGMTFSGGLLDWVIFGAVQIPGGSNAWWPLVFGLAYAPIYFFFFKWAIKRFDIATPGRGGTTKLFSKEDYSNKQQINLNNQSFDPMAIEIIKAYGGISNIKNVDACITKLRVEVDAQNDVNEAFLKSDLGAVGTIRPSAKSVYAIYGAKADFYKNEMIKILKAVEKTPSLKQELFDNNKVTVQKNKSSDSKVIADHSILKVYAPVSGKILDLSQVSDETFSKKMLGDGVAIIPSNNQFNAVVDGVCSSAFHTGHAYSFQAIDQSEILVHIGIDATTLKIKNEKGEIVKLFKPLVQKDQKVNLQTQIALVNQRLLKMPDKSVTPIIIMNESLNGRKVKVVAQGQVSKGDLLFVVE